MVNGDIIVEEDILLLEAMNTLNDAKVKVLFVVSGEKLVASLTDGDVRRWILSGGGLDVKVKKVANYNPKFVYEDGSCDFDSICAKYSICALPVVNSEKKIVSIIFNESSIEYDSFKDKVPIVIMAGGKGTRLYPYTKILPKPLIPIGDIPIVEHIINEFMQYKASDFYMIVNHKKGMIKSYFNDIEKDFNVYFIDEEEPLGTGGGIYLLKNIINSTFFLTNCDILVKEDYTKIYDFHVKENNFITMVCSIKNVTIPYGVVELNKDGTIGKMQEKPQLSFLTNTGMYVVDCRVIEEMENNVSIGFPEIIDKYKIKGKKIGVYPIAEDAWMDMGQIEEMEKMRKILEK